MDYQKIAPGLISALTDFREDGRVGLKMHMKTLGLVSETRSPKQPRAVVFLHTDENANLDHLSKLGVEVNQSKGTVRTAILPLENIEKVSGDPAIKRIVPSSYMRSKMDLAGAKVHIPDFSRRFDPNLDGNGVVVGVVDTGIDPNHPAFRGRILRIWDQTLSGPGVREGGYGIELEDRILTVSRDSEGHGTHVAGIAAGSDVDGHFSGIAPEARLVIVKTTFNDAHIADGVRYIFRVAGDAGLPAVVNLSLGGHFNQHDGTDSLSTIINEASGPGKIVCCAAGNEGNDNIHAKVNLTQGLTKSIRFKVPLSPASLGLNSVLAAYLNGWYSGKDNIEVAVQSPSGATTPLQNVISKGDPSRTYTLRDGRVEIITPGPSPENGDHNFIVVLKHRFAENMPVTPGVWRLILRGANIKSGRVDAWMMDDSPTLDVTFTGTSTSDDTKVGSPGAAAKAITVGAFTTRNHWLDIDRNNQRIGFDENTISDFSSEGPLRTGGIKPDLVAPGAMIVSCLSVDSEVDRSEMINERFRVMAGTSMATPLVTGIVTLMLQKNPQLDPDGAKTIFKANCTIPGKEPGSFDSKWGYGLIDAVNMDL
jgi:subtilisin family serine protease